MGAIAPTLQTTYTGAGGLGSASTSITVGAGSNQVLVIIVSVNANSSPTPTWNGSSTGVTAADSFFSSGANTKLSIWYLLNPTQTTANLAVTGTSNTGIQGYLFNGVDLSSPIGATITGGDTSSDPTSLALTTNRNNSIVVSGIGTANALDASASGTNQTLGANVLMGGGNPRIADSTQTTTTAGSYTQSFSFGSNARRAMVSVEIHGMVTVDNTLAIGQGSFTLTGQTLTLRKAISLILGQGSYVLSGQAMGFGRKIVLAFGSYALTGQSILFKLLVWTRMTKHMSVMINGTKNSSIWTDANKNSSTFNNQDKS